MNIYRVTVCFLAFSTSCADPAGKSAASSRATSTTIPGAAGAQPLVLSDPELRDLSLKNLKAIAEEHQKQNREGFNTLQQFNAVNQGLCQRLNSMRQSCVPMVSIVPTGESGVLKCSVLETKDPASDKAERVDIVVSVPVGLKGTYVLVADSIYESDTFGGTPAKNCTQSGGMNRCRIKFNLAKGTITTPPQFRTLASLDVRPVLPAGMSNPALIEALPSVEEFKLELSVNDTVLINSPLQAVESGALAGKRYSLNLGDILNKTRSDLCQVDQEEVNRLTKAVMDKVTAYQAKQDQTDAGGLKAPIGMSAEQERAYWGKVISQADGEIEERTRYLNDERNRTLELSNELKKNRAVGCKAAEIVKTIDINIEGHPIAKEILPGVRRTHPFLPDLNHPNPEYKKIYFRFSNSLEFEQPDFTNAIKIKAPEGLAIRDLKYLQFRKGAVQYDNIPYDESGLVSKFFEGEHWTYEVYELGVFAINRVEILVNDQKIFDQAGLNLKMRTGSLYWTSDDLLFNNYYTKLMNDTNCPATN